MKSREYFRNGVYSLRHVEDVMLYSLKTGKNEHQSTVPIRMPVEHNLPNDSHVVSIGLKLDTQL